MQGINAFKNRFFSGTASLASRNYSSTSNRAKHECLYSWPLLERGEVGDVGPQVVQPSVLRAQVERQVQRRARAAPARAAPAAAARRHAAAPSVQKYLFKFVHKKHFYK